MSHSPSTPSRLNCSRCVSMKPSAYSSHALRMAAGVASVLPSFRICCVTLNSIGNPWQSQPGTYGTCLPRIVWYLRMKSLRILFSAVPMCTSPLANGGPSCSKKRSAPSRRFWICSYRLSAYHLAKRSGSRCTRPARIGKSVCGRFSVFLYSISNSAPPGRRGNLPARLAKRNNLFRKQPSAWLSILV